MINTVYKDINGIEIQKGDLVFFNYRRDLRSFGAILLKNNDLYVKAMYHGKRGGVIAIEDHLNIEIIHRVKNLKDARQSNHSFLLNKVISFIKEREYVTKRQIIKFLPESSHTQIDWIVKVLRQKGLLTSRKETIYRIF